MGTPREIQVADPTIPTPEELQLELSDRVLQGLGLPYATKYLLFRAVRTGGPEISKREGEIRNTLAQLMQLFPNQRITFTPAVEWIRRASFEAITAR